MTYGSHSWRKRKVQREQRIIARAELAAAALGGEIISWPTFYDLRWAARFSNGQISMAFARRVHACEHYLDCVERGLA